MTRGWKKKIWDPCIAVSLLHLVDFVESVYICVNEKN